jgi:biotin operon repressor
MTEQRIFRGRHKSNFSAFSNGIWEDDGLSIEAKGTLGYLLSRPPNWHVRIAQVGRKLDIGRDKLRRIIRELIEAGYVERVQVRKGKVFGAMRYFVRDQPASVAPLSQTGFQSTDFQSTDFPSTEKPSALIKKEDSTKKDSYKITSSTKPLSQTFPIAPTTPAAAKRLGDEGARRREHQSIVQARLAERLGCGNVEAGWLILGTLTDSECESLTVQERTGRLTPDLVAELALRLRTRLSKAESTA